MKSLRTAPLFLALLLLLCASCAPPAPAGASPSPTLSAQEEAEVDAALDAQLGALKDLVTGEQRDRLRAFLTQVLPLRQARLEEGVYEKSARETHLWEQINRLLERYTVQYLGDGGSWDYGDDNETYLAGYLIQDGAQLRPDPGFTPSGSGAWTEEDFLALWERMRAILPEGAYEDFDRFTVFTDGEDGVLAYVTASDYRGSTWEIAVDPADAEDEGWFTETVLHEYCHYLTLNDEQVTYTDRQTTDTYNEAGMVSAPGSYLDDFYQAFWTGYLDDRLANPDSCNFFLRHEDDFVTDYASTSPSEDIAESFTYFVVYPPQEGDEVWVQKLNFFYDYPERVAFRTAVRQRLGCTD